MISITNENIRIMTIILITIITLAEMYLAYKLKDYQAYSLLLWLMYGVWKTIQMVSN